MQTSSEITSQAKQERIHRALHDHLLFLLQEGTLQAEDLHDACTQAIHSYEAWKRTMQRAPAW